ncbi:hypothetical protein NQ314_000752 [Rhamnusium bicolor]|uniref:CHK kinase-like domain-containing protein n=1 Tax=Rhamnusium bicolor TaxID=1586634 RepID=A0AAV8ZVU4_9CUCU|nr:hypothetical protein NQ314_000752 [Rhamnusium bicolor]
MGRKPQHQEVAVYETCGAEKMNRKDEEKQCHGLDIVNSKVVCKEDYLDDNKCNSALTAIARLHAASIIFEEIRSTEENPFRINEHFIKEVAETTFSFQSGHVRNLWCNSATNCLENLSKFFTDNSAVAGKIKEYVFSEEGLRKFLRPSEKYRNTVCHDDLWRNNMMFNEINTCVLVDFQLTSVEEYRLPALVESGLYGTNVYLSKDMSNLVTSSTEIFEEFTFKNRSPFIIKEFQTNDNFRLRFSNVLKPLYEMFEEM